MRISLLPTKVNRSIGPTMIENSLHQSLTDSGRLGSFILVLWY